MRYFKLKEVYASKELLNGRDIMIDYKSMLMTLMAQEARLTVEQFLRTTAFFKTVNDAQPGDTLHIDDQDFAIMMIKLPEYVATLKGFVVSCPEIAQFIQDLQNAPTKLPEAVSDAGNKDKEAV